MTAETRLLLELKWREQSAKDCVSWAEGTGVKDKARLEDFKAGVLAGWDACISSMKLHGLLTLK